MKPAKALIGIKLLHTLIWAFFASQVFYLLYSSIANVINLYTWLAIGFIIGEGITLLIFGWKCPLTLIAQKYSDSTRDNFDIYLPNWLARHNKVIFTTLFVVALLILCYRIVAGMN
jgi:hypothetical protein